VHRVMLVIGANQIGGAERQVQQLARAFLQSGVAASIVFLERPGRRPQGDQLDLRGLPHHYLHSRSLSRRWARWRLARLLKSERPDILHLYNLEAMELAAPVARRLGVPIVIGNVRGLLFTLDAGIRERLRSVSSLCDAVTGNCTAISEAIASLHLRGPLMTPTISNIIEFAPPSTTSRRAASQPARVLFVATLKPVKDPQTFIRAGLQLLAAKRSVEFLLAGDGPMRGELEELVATSDAQSKFSFLGRMNPSALPYSSSALTVSTSRSEGASNTILESLAHGCPVVATAVGGSVEILQNSRAGILVPPGAPQATADAIARLLDSSEEREMMGCLGRAYIAEKHAPAMVLAQQLELFQRLRSLKKADTQ